MIDTDELNPMIRRACLLGVERHGMREGEVGSLLDELEELVGNLGIGIALKKVVKVRDPQAAFLLGTGKVQEVLEEVYANQCDSIIFDEELTPAQQRNWEKEAGGKILVIDRQEIILDIFNSRATTKEARLQVELARLEYELPRMKRAWTHLDRQRGGGAVQRDAGETQLEMDQRLIRTRIARVKHELKDVVRHRETQRKQRMKVPLPSAAIVGYTNAGKSSLLNRLTGAEVLAANKLFATLDPTTRRLELPNGQAMLLTDTVGFVRKLPHRLVEAFKATLEEAVVSTFLIHVVDASSPEAEAHYRTTMSVLKELGADTKRIVTVFNKIDVGLDGLHEAELHHDHPEAIFLSAQTGEGCDRLLEKCQEMLKDFSRPMQLLIPHNRYDLINKLHQAGAVTSEEAVAEGVRIDGNIPTRLVEPLGEFLVKHD